MRRVWVMFAVGLLACDASPEQEQRDVCTAFCGCDSTLPSAQESCIVDKCMPTLVGPSEQCLDCVYTNSQTCSTLVNQCDPLCFFAPRPGEANDE